MSMSDEITRLQTAKADLKTVINNLGGDITDELIDEYASILEALPIGGKPTLYAPYITLEGSVISITPNTNNGAFVTGYHIFVNHVLAATIEPLSQFDLDELEITAEGGYLIYLKAYGTNFNDSALSNTVTYVISPPPPPTGIYGVSGLYQSSPALTRTDDAVGMSFAINSSTGTIASDFDSVFPWNEATIETIGNNKFLKMPDMWFRVGFDSSKRITDIAVSKEQGDTGNWYKVDSFYYGTNGGSLNGTKLESKPGVARLHTKTRAEFRTYATNNGSGYFQLDLYHKTIMNFLWLIEWATKNSANIMEGVTGVYGSAVNTGGTDSLVTPSGFNTATKQMRWHYIEDFVGNYYEFVDGVVWSTDLYVSSNPTNYNDTSTNLIKSNLVRNPNGQCLSALGWDENNPFLCYGIETVSNDSYNTHFCDSVYINDSTSPVLFCGATWIYTFAYNGVFYCNRIDVSYSRSHIGSRLLYKPL